MLRGQYFPRIQDILNTCPILVEKIIQDIPCLNALIMVVNSGRGIHTSRGSQVDHAECVNTSQL